MMFGYFCLEIFQYYIDIFCLNIEFSRYNFFTYSIHVERLVKVSQYYKAMYPKTFKEPSFFVHYSLADFRIFKTPGLLSIHMDEIYGSVYNF